MKSEDILKMKQEDHLKKEIELKQDDDNFFLYSVTLGGALTTAAVWPILVTSPKLRIYIKLSTNQSLKRLSLVCAEFGKIFVFRKTGWNHLEKIALLELN